MGRVEHDHPRQIFFTLHLLERGCWPSEHDIRSQSDGLDGGPACGSVLADGEVKRAATRAPELGEHTDDILREAGWNEADIARLKRTRVVQAATNEPTPPPSLKGTP